MLKAAQNVCRGAVTAAVRRQQQPSRLFSVLNIGSDDAYKTFLEQNADGNAGERASGARRAGPPRGIAWRRLLTLPPPVRLPPMCLPPTLHAAHSHAPRAATPPSCLCHRCCSVVYFTASWCGPCKQISPLYEQLSEERKGVAFAKVDVDELEDTAAEAGISAMPTFQFHSKGEKAGEVVGADMQKLTAGLDNLA